MKYSILSLLFLAALCLSSCEKKDFSKDKWDKEDEICFELLYPVSYTMPDGSTITAADEKQYWTLIKGWYEENPEVEEKPELLYPVDIKYTVGTIETIQDEAEMIAVKEDCADEDDE
ncbi:MAG: hypothetical protein DWQ02_15685 [Bacteroidetes bacterium]|nr:MAG: hypothetical protein DWQ02_15685 [Bacteroidota bacterium]